MGDRIYSCFCDSSAFGNVTNYFFASLTGSHREGGRKEGRKEGRKGGREGGGRREGGREGRKEGTRDNTHKSVSGALRHSLSPSSVSICITELGNKSAGLR